MVAKFSRQIYNMGRLFTKCPPSAESNHGVLYYTILYNFKHNESNYALRLNTGQGLLK